MAKNTTATKRAEIKKQKQAELRADMEQIDNLLYGIKDEVENTECEIRGILEKHGVNPDGCLHHVKPALAAAAVKARELSSLSYELDGFSATDELDQ